jgi:hypothetical protein
VYNLLITDIPRLSLTLVFLAQEAVAATSKACELFLMQFIEKAKDEAIVCGRKTVKVEDILKVVDQNQVKFEFLNDAFSLTPKR